MPTDIASVLNDALEIAAKDQDGKIANYIPELASVDPELTGAAVRLLDGECVVVGDAATVKVTLQSIAKVVVLIGLLEDFGPKKVFSWVRVEPSGDDFASVARLDQFGPLPSNPMLNAGAISLCSHIPGNAEEQYAWLSKWMETVFNETLNVNHQVFASERRTGDRNRSLGYLLKSNNIIEGSVNAVLETYFCSCSFEATIEQISYLAMLLANKGCAPDGTQVISLRTVQQTLAIMATCGIYNESGTHLVRTGMPAKSSVSGLIVAVALGHGGVVTFSPRINRKGTSMRGELILEHLSDALKWHFAG